MKLFANGDSYTFGGGIWQNHSYNRLKGVTELMTPYLDWPENKERLSSVYSGRLAEKLGASELHNHSICGSSNRRITRTTLDYFYSAIERGEDLSDYFAIIQWSELARNEFNHEGKWHYMNPQWISPEPPGSINSVCEAIKNYFYKHVQSDRQDITDFVAQVTALGNFFNRYGIRYMFCTHVPLFLWIRPLLAEWEVDKLDATIKLLGREFVWFHGSIQDSNIDALIDNNQRVKPPSDTHPNLEGHQQIANAMHNWIITQGLLEKQP